MLLRFCYRETNSVADFLAKWGSRLQSEEEKSFDKTEQCFGKILYKDLADICTSKTRDDVLVLNF